MRSTIGIGGVVLLVVALAGCAQPTAAEPSGGAATGPGATRSSSHGGPVRDQVSLVDNLRQRGVAVETIGPAQQPFLAAPGTQLRLSGAELSNPVTIDSYEYETADAAGQDVATIEPDGSPRTQKASWVGPPHFYHRERLIVLYVGADRAVVSLLAELLGPQFAGR